MDPTRTLLTAYVTKHSQAAFQELVKIKLDLVYGVALRRTGGDEGMARDIVQVVFIDLARKAGSFSEEMIIEGWLHRHAGFIAAKMIRTEQRRRQREHTAAMMDTHNSSDDEALWQRVAPLLDGVLDQLPPEDRDAVVLRYLEGRGLREVGISLGVSENAARMRVTRALEKLRQALERRGVTDTTMAMTGALAFAPRVQAPGEWAGAIAGLTIKMAPAPVAAAGGGGLVIKGAALLASVGLIGGIAALYPAQPSQVAGPREIAQVNYSTLTINRPPSSVKEKVLRPEVPHMPAPELEPVPPIVVVAPPVALPVREPGGDPGVLAKLTLGVLPAVMKFDVELLMVRAGQPVMLLYRNAKCPLQHNFILVKPGALAEFGILADRMLTDPQAMMKHYLPASVDILAQSTKLIGLGESDLIEFTAPALPGDYPFLCTFPGHWRLMHGILRVVP